MRAVKNTTTNRLVYRESPDFKKGYGIKNALALDLGFPDELIEVTVTHADWDAELLLLSQETPPSSETRLDLLTLRIENLEKVILAISQAPPPP